MKGDPEERAVQIGRYLVQSGATVRAAAQVFGVSKSTVWKDQCRLQHLAPGLWQEVRAVLLYNKAQRHLRGGIALLVLNALIGQFHIASPLCYPLIILFPNENAPRCAANAGNSITSFRPSCGR